MDPETYQLPGHIHDGMALPSTSPQSLVERVKDFRFDDSDTVIVSYPKTGTTWLQEIVWLIVNGGDIEAANRTPSMMRVPFLESEDPTNKVASLDIVPTMAPPRVLKSHLPVRYFLKQLKGDNCKFFVPVRNPKDTLVSMFHFYRMSQVLGNFAGTWDEFFKLYLANQVMYGSYFDWYEGWWLECANSKVLFVHYEDMKRDPIAGIKRVSDFLGEIVPDEIIRQIAKHCDFSAMKTNKATNAEHIPMELMNSGISPFIRSGKVADWKNYFTKKQSDTIDEMYESRLKSIGLLLAFE